jgi:hypothetical protein
MTPEEFAQLQRVLTANAQEQTRLLKRIGDKVEFLGWCIVILVLIVLSMAAYHR